MNRSDRTAGYQRWAQLLFAHWRVPPENLQPLLPADLTIETFDGDAWVGFVPFSMERVRPRWFVATPGISWFLETNIRTYVRHIDGTTGVWFLSLDADHRLAVWIARRFWHLPYFYSRLGLLKTEGRIQYRGQRPDGSGGYEVEAMLGDSNLQIAEPQTLDHFLLERYLLFAATPDGRLRKGAVHHAPYEFQPVVDFCLTQQLSDCHGIPFNREPDHLVYSPGVNVRVSPLVAM